MIKDCSGETVTSNPPPTTTPAEAIKVINTSAPPLEITEQMVSFEVAGNPSYPSEPADMYCPIKWELEQWTHTNTRYRTTGDPATVPAPLVFPDCCDIIPLPNTCLNCPLNLWQVLNKRESKAAADVFFREDDYHGLPFEVAQTNTYCDASETATKRISEGTSATTVAACQAACIADVTCVEFAFGKGGATV